MQRNYLIIAIVLVAILIAATGFSYMLYNPSQGPENNSVNNSTLNTTNNTNTTTVTKDADTKGNGKKLVECPMCEGSGLVGHHVECQSCGGTGYIGDEICTKCDGTGYLFKPNSIKCQVCGGRGLIVEGSVKQI